MTFQAPHFQGLVALASEVQERLFTQYGGHRHFDLAIVGSGVGGGLLADELANRVGGAKRILVLEAGSLPFSHARVQHLPLRQRGRGAELRRAELLAARPLLGRTLHPRATPDELRRGQASGDSISARSIPSCGSEYVGDDHGAGLRRRRW